jgi:NADPH2:quinone reductase
MRAWIMDDFSWIGGLRLGEVPDPVPGDGEVVLRVRYAGLNPADRYLAERQYPAKPPLPHILGRDGVGIVLAVGAGVDAVAVGDLRVVLRGDAGVEKPGTFAERVLVPAQDLVAVPAGWSEPEAAGASLVYLTAHQALTQWGSLPPASVVLVTGASGGVGVATVQLAAAMGFSVVALSRDGEKRARLLSLGASQVFDPGDGEWRKKLKAAFGQRRVDLAVDNVGGTGLPEVIETLGYGGRVSLVGRLAGPVPEFNTSTLFFRRLRLGGVAVGTYTNAESRAAWEAIVASLARTNARPLVDSAHPFDRLHEAFARLGSGPMGKVLLAIDGAATG